MRLSNIQLIDIFHFQDLKEYMNEKTKKSLMEIYRVITTTSLPSFKMTDSILKPIESEYASSQIVKFINSNKGNTLSYEFSLSGRRIVVQFIVYQPIDRKKYEKYMKYIMSVLCTLDHFSSKTCLKSKELIICLYMTPFKKLIPKGGSIGAHSVNTGVNSKDITCSSTTHEHINEITIFREEDWFKVLIHESIHSFRLDFSNSGKEMLELFRVNSEVNLFEAYTEFWAEIINMLYCSILLETQHSFEKVMEIMNVLLQIERRFALFQAVKILHHMDLNYKTLVQKGSAKYKEESNVLSYFIIKMCLMYHYNDFIECCKKNCHNLIAFDESKIQSLFYFIKSWYMNPFLLQDIDSMEELFSNTTNKELLETTRMTLFEIK